MEASSSGDAYGGRGAEVLAVTWLLMGVTTVVILLRFYVRFFMVQQVCGYNDFWSLLWTVLAWLFGTIATCFMTVAVHYGYGNHVDVVEAHGSLSKSLIHAWIWLTFSFFMIVLAKSAVVALFIHFQGPVDNIQKYTMFTLLGLSWCISIVNVFLFWFQCSPPTKLWRVESGSCRLVHITYDFSIFGGSWSAFVDLFLALYPVAIVYQLRISMRLRLILSAVLAVGIFSSVCACMRVYQLTRSYESSDPTYDSVPLALWGAAEEWIILISSGIPATWPLFERFIDPSSAYQGQDGLSPEKQRQHNDLELSPTRGTSASTEPNDLSETSTLHNSYQSQRLEGAIAVRQEVTVDRENRRRSHGPRPRTRTLSWARRDRGNSLARFSSTRTLRSPSWAHGAHS